jgi:hypothetical protein
MGRVRGSASRGRKTIQSQPADRRSRTLGTTYSRPRAARLDGRCSHRLRATAGPRRETPGKGRSKAPAGTLDGAPRKPFRSACRDPRRPLERASRGACPGLRDRPPGGLCRPPSGSASATPATRLKRSRIHRSTGPLNAPRRSVRAPSQIPRRAPPRPPQRVSQNRSQRVPNDPSERSTNRRDDPPTTPPEVSQNRLNDP